MDGLNSEELLGKVLKDVSRAFYLSMRILPASCRPAISVGYLLARAADTLADNPSRTPEERLNDLQAWKAVVKGEADGEARGRFWQRLRLYVLQAAAKVGGQSAEGVWDGESLPESCGPADLREALAALEKAGKGGKNPGITDGEARLLLRLSEAYELFVNLDDFALREVREVVITLISGMEWDLSYFPGAFTEPEQLEKYAYLVAGCVGRFWTRITAHYLQAVKPEDMERWRN